MEFREYPMVEGAYDRRFTFSEIKWLNKRKFLERLADRLATSQYSATAVPSIHPHIINTSYVRANNNSRLKQNTNKTFVINDDSDKIFIGKTIPKSPFHSAEESTAEGFFHSTDGNSENHEHEHHEIVGSVYNFNGSWRLRITHDDQVHDIDDDFLVLDLEPDSFYWAKNSSESDNSSMYMTSNNKEIPRFALRATIDQRAYSYIGRTVVEQSTPDKPMKYKRPKFYANAWLHFNYDIPQTFGKIKRPQKLLFAPVQNLELGFDQFETLCLKASPSSLKVLCRSTIRTALNYSQSKIKSLSSNGSGSLTDKHLPDSLVAYLKYPSHLKVGEYMLADEKLVRDDDEFELVIDPSSGHLVSRSCKQDAVVTRAAAEEHTEMNAAKEQQQQANKIHGFNVDIVWLHRFHCCFYSNSSLSAFIAHSIYNSLQFYKFFIDWDKEVPTSQVQPIRRRVIVS